MGKSVQKVNKNPLPLLSLSCTFFYNKILLVFWIQQNAMVIV